MVGYTYDTLIQDIKDNLEEDSSEFDSALPFIIERAQAFLQRRVDPLELIRRQIVTHAFTSGDGLLTLPDDVRILQNVALINQSTSVPASRTEVLQQTYEYAIAYWPDQTSVAASVKYWAPIDNERIMLVPPVSTTANFELKYVANVSVLSSTVNSNLFAEKMPEAFFNAAMMYANMWTKNSNAVEIWKAAANEEIMTINNEARRTRGSDAANKQNGTPTNTIGGTT